MRIAIFETEHFEVAYPVIKLFDNEVNDITVFVYEKAYRQLALMFKDDILRYNWIIKREQESKYSFMFRMFREIKKHNIDILYFSTISDNHLLYYVLVRCLSIRTILTLHDINGFFNGKLAFNIRRLAGIAGKKLLVNVVQEFNVISLTMAGYLKSKLPANRKIYCIPGAIYEPQLQATAVHAPASILQMVVPGTIDRRRRNYGMVFDLLEEIKRLSLPVSIVLLGGHYGFYGKQVLQRCRKYAEDGYNIKCYETDVVDQPEYTHVMQSAHLVWIPCITGEVIFDHAAEKYGISKSSGNIYDVVKFAKPFLAPASLPFDAYLENSCMRYTDISDVIRYLQTILQKPDMYVTLKQSAVRASMEYTVQQVRSRNAGLLS